MSYLAELNRQALFAARARKRGNQAERDRILQRDASMIGISTHELIRRQWLEVLDIRENPPLIPPSGRYQSAY